MAGTRLWIREPLASWASGKTGKSGLKIPSRYGIEYKAIVEFETLTNTTKEKNINLFKAQALFFPLMILLIGVSNVMVIYIGGMRYDILKDP